MMVKAMMAMAMAMVMAVVNMVMIFQSCLNGEFLRIGPNPRFEPIAGYHW
jgi:hypothetical protein